MPGTFNPLSDSIRYIDWTRYFADREREWSLISQLLHSLSRPLLSVDHSMLHFYGVSGQGKTLLFQKARRHAAESPGATRFAFIELQSLNNQAVRIPAECMWHVVAALARAGVPAPLTLSLYAQAPFQKRPD